MLRWLALSPALLLAGLLLFSACSRSEGPSDALVVGTNAEYPPYTYIEGGEIVGFDIDVAREVCRRLDKAMTLKDMPFEALLPALQLGNIDIIAAGLGATPERAKRVLFSRSYLQSDALVIITLQGKPFKDVAALRGKKVIVNDGFTADLYMSGQEGVTLIRLPTAADALMALKAGRADAFVANQSTVANMQKTLGLPLNTVVIEGTGENVALAFPKERAGLQQQVQTALDAMVADGTLQRLKDKWGL